MLYADSDLLAVATAEAMAAGYTRVEDIGWYDDPVPVPDPRLA